MIGELQLEATLAASSMKKRMRVDAEELAGSRTTIHNNDTPQTGQPTPGGEKDARPEKPTPDDCLLADGVIRWEGEVRVEPRLCALLRAVLASPDHRITYVQVFKVVLNGYRCEDKTVLNYCSALSAALKEIRFPCKVGTKNKHVVLKPWG